MKFRTLILWFAVIGGLWPARDAAAQTLTLRIDNGLVTLDANNVTVDEILARWTAVTGLNVVSKSGVGSDATVTLRLSGVSEREALQTVLRDLSGYIMGERFDPQTGLVTVDRLLILPQGGSQTPATPMPRFASGDRSPFVGLAGPAAAIVEPAIAEVPSENDVPVELAPAPGRSSSIPTLIGNGPTAVFDLTGWGEPKPDRGAGDAPRAPAAPASPFGNARGTARPGEMTPQTPGGALPQIIRR